MTRKREVWTTKERPKNERMERKKIWSKERSGNRMTD